MENRKLFSNDALRQKFVDNTVPQIQQLGLSVPDPDLKFNQETGHYEYGQVNWDEFFAVIAGQGPCNQERMDAPSCQAWEGGKWVRDSAAVYANKLQQNQDAQKVA